MIEYPIHLLNHGGGPIKVGGVHGPRWGVCVAQGGGGESAVEEQPTY